jgi:hypothetical protein
MSCCRPSLANGVISPMHMGRIRNGCFTAKKEKRKIKIFGSVFRQVP